MQRLRRYYNVREAPVTIMRSNGFHRCRCVVVNVHGIDVQVAERVVSIAIRFGLVRRFCSPGFCPVWGFRGFCYPVRRMFARFLRCIVVVVFILFPVPQFGLVGCHMRVCVGVC